jgi:poly-beta-1,6-N-acetyl-D-glucosamine synthase
MILAWCTVIVFFVYTIVLLVHAVGFINHEQVTTPTIKSDIKVTIIICARNEEKTVARCLSGILQQNYPPQQIEIIVINDAGTDQTVRIAEKLLSTSSVSYKLISNATHKGKKQSLSNAISMAHHDFIITRDADTYTDSNEWLASICTHHQLTGSNFIIAPVQLTNNYGMLWALQAIEMRLLQLFTIGSVYFKFPYLCNGANLAFHRSLFESVNGYESHLQIASGDDVLLLEAVKKLPHASISFLKAKVAIVKTYPEYSLKALLHQKVRWAGKYKLNPNPINTLVALCIFTTNLVWLINLLASFINPLYSAFGLIFVVFKLIIDILLLFLSGYFIKNKFIAVFALPVGLIYPIYTLLVAISSLFIKPKWKESKT